MGQCSRMAAGGKIMTKKQYNILRLLFWVAGVMILFVRAFYKLSCPVPLYEDGRWTGELFYHGLIKVLFTTGETYFVFGDILPVWFAKVMNQVFFGQNIVPAYA